MERPTGKRILVVEDEADMAALLKSRLEVSGYSVQTASTGTEALDDAAAQLPDLVVLDLRLPDIHGYAVCRQLRQMATPWELPILMLTAMDQPVDRLRGIGFGADVYLTKPFNSNEFVGTVNMLLAQKALRDEDALLP